MATSKSSSTRARRWAVRAPVRTRSSSSQPDISGSTVPAEVGIGKNDGGFGIIGKISADILNVDAATAKDLIEKAHQVRPYSKATRGNITVELAV